MYVYITYTDPVSRRRVDGGGIYIALGGSDLADGCVLASWHVIYRLLAYSNHHRFCVEKTHSGVREHVL